MSIVALSKRAATGIGEVCIVLLITLALLEITLWVLALRSKSVAFMTASVLSETLPDSALGLRLNPDYPSHDRDGFRNAAVLQHADIVAIGDSQTYGANNQAKDAWPQQLGALSGKPVYSMAVGGYGPVQYLMLTPGGLAKHPAWLVTGLYDGNDLFDSFHMVYTQKQMTDLASKDAAVLGAIDRAQAANRIEDVADHFSAITTGDFGAQASESAETKLSLLGRAVQQFKSHCKTWNLFRTIRRIVMEKGVSSQSGLLDKMAWNSLTKKAANSNGYWLAFEKGSTRTILVPSYRAIALDMNDPRIAEGARISEDAMKRSQAEAQAANAKFAVLMIPTKELVFYRAFSNSGDATIQQLSSLAAMEMQFRAQFQRNVCDQGIVCIDPLPALSASLKAGRSPYPLDFDGHPNAIGHAVLADAVWKAIEQHP